MHFIYQLYILPDKPYNTCELKSFPCVVAENNLLANTNLYMV